jgi:predicted permease
MKRLFDVLRLRLRSIFHPAAADATLRDEIELHLQEQIDEYIAAGMSAADARAAALRTFGPVAPIEEQCRDTRRVGFVEHLAQDLRYARRSLSHQPALVIAASLSIAVAIGANTTIFGLFSELFLALPSAQRPEQLVQIRMGGGSHVSHRQWRDLNGSGALAGIAGFSIESNVNWQGPDHSLSLVPMVVTENFFDLLGVPVASGRGFSTHEARADRNPALVVISDRFWRQRLASDPTVLGRTLIFNGKPYAVVGVLPPTLRSIAGFGLAPEVYLPLSRALAPDLDRVDAAHVQLVGRLKGDQAIGAGRAALAAVAPPLAEEYGNNHFATVAEFAALRSVDALGSLTLVGGFFLVLLAAVGLVLAIACANVAGLLLSRATVRRREMAVRVALGASRRRLVQQLLAEGFWLAVVGAAAGLLIMVVLGRAISLVSLPLPLPLDVRPRIDAKLLAYTAVLMIATTFLCALAPALQATRRSQIAGLKQQGPAQGGRWLSMRRLVVIGQMAIAQLLLVTAALFLTNLARARELNPGFDVARTLVAQLDFVEGRYTPDTRTAFLDSVVERLRALPNVTAASYAYGAPLTVRSGMTHGLDLKLADTGREFHAVYEVNFVAPGFFESIGMPLRRGRGFYADDRFGAANVIVINDEFARRYFPGEDPLGRVISMPGAANNTYPAEIVGIAGNGRHRTLGETQRAAIFEPYAQWRSDRRLAHVFVRTTTGPESAVRDVSNVIREMDGSAAVVVQPMRDALAFAFMPSRLGAGLLGTLGIIGLVLALVGMFAVVSYSVSRRTPEIGIRMALGASRIAIMRLVIREAVVLASTGIVLGLAAAWFLTSPLADFLVAGLSPSDPRAFGLTGILLLMVSVAAAWGPMRRALRIDPAAAVRTE